MHRIKDLSSVYLIVENRVLKATFSDRLTDPKSQDASSGVNARIIYNGR